MKRASEASLLFLGFPRKKKPRHNGGYEHRVTKIKNKTSCCTRYVCVRGCLCVIQHRNWPLRSTILNAHGTNASLDGLCTRTHTNEAFSCWFAVIRLDLIKPGAETCVFQAKSRSPTDQPVRKFKDSLGSNMTMKTFITLHIASCEKHSMVVYIYEPYPWSQSVVARR